MFMEITYPYRFRKSSKGTAFYYKDINLFLFTSKL